MAIVGGGAVGCAVAHELASSGSKDVFVLERAPHVGEGQSGRNSGVVHAGIYYPTGSLKAELCIESNELMYAFCAKHGVAVERVGKLVVARNSEEEAELNDVFALARNNGVPGVEMLTSAAIHALEPNVRVAAAMHAPSTGIVDAAGLTNTLAALATNAGAQVLTSFEVVDVTPTSGAFRLVGQRGGNEEHFEAEVVVNAAGLYSDSVARMIDPQFEPQIAPLRGEYYTFSRRRREELWLNAMNIYPVPCPLDVGGQQLRMVGVHLTPTFSMSRDGRVAIGDTVTVGPEFARATSKEDYEKDRLPAELFLQRAAGFFPGLGLDDLRLGFTGIMASLNVGKDFIIRPDDNHAGCIQLVGIDSPGLTCCLAIARRVRRLLS